MSHLQSRRLLPIMASDLTPRSHLEPRRGFLQHAAVAAATGSLASAASSVAASTPSGRAIRSPAATAAVDHRTFNARNTALVLVDHQVGTVGWAAELSTEDERNQLKMWVRVMARFARSAGIPTVLTSSLESESQGPLLPEFKEILPAEYEARIQRRGVINAWDAPAGDVPNSVERMR